MSIHGDLANASQCAHLPDDLWMMIIETIAEQHGLRAGKELRKQARVSRVFATAARDHPDNNSIPW